MSIKSEVLHFVLLWSCAPVRCRSHIEYPDVRVIASIHIKELPQHLKKDVMSLSVSRYHSHHKYPDVGVIASKHISVSSPKIRRLQSHCQYTDVIPFTLSSESSPVERYHSQHPSSTQMSESFPGDRYQSHHQSSNQMSESSTVQN